MRTPLLALSLALTLTACQARLPGFNETRITGTREGEAASWASAAAPAPAQPAVAPAQEAATAPVDATPPAGGVPATAAAEPPAEAAPAPEADGAMALLALKAYVDAYKAKDPAKVASFEAALLAARRKAEVETAGQFEWSIERGHAEVFLKGQDFNLVTADFKQIAVDQAGDTITLRTKDGSPLLRATFKLEGASGSHVIEKIVLTRGADGQMQVAALPFEAGAAAVPAPIADEAEWPLPEGPIVTGPEREAALDVVAALNDAYARKDAAAVVALLPDAVASSVRDRLADDLADILFSVRPLARDLLTVVAVGDELEVVGPRAVIASFPFKRDGQVVQVKHGAIRLKKDGDAWVITRACDDPAACE